MAKLKIINFQDLLIKNADISKKPFDETSFNEEDILTVVVLRDPYVYFDHLLDHCINNEMSPKLTKETKKAMKNLNNEAFLQWLTTLNYLPLINPQTFQLDLRKRVDIAIDNLESFDYVLPYEEIDMFLEHVASDITIKKQEKSNYPFSISTLKNSELVNTFIGKDIQLHERGKELWEEIKKHDFQSVSSFMERKKPLAKKKIGKFIGMVDRISVNSIAGWIFRENDKETLEVMIYKNDILVQKVKADILRPNTQKLKGHPTGHCGFEAIFNEDIFTKSDKIEVKILPDKTSVVLGQNARKFFNL